MNIDLTGKNAMVTGAARGIGRDTALALAGAGANVACVDMLDTAETAGEIEKKGRKALQIKADVSKFEEVEAAVNRAAEALGSLDVLVNNAGVTRDGLLMRMSDQDWDLVLGVNLKGPFNFIKAASRIMMKQRSGCIVNVASVSGIMGNYGQANYASSKGGLISLTKTAAREMASRGVRVNAVAPGFIRTDMTAKMDQKVLDQVMANIPLKRMGETSDIANAIAFLASDQASYVTGQVLVVDGGMVM